MTFMTIDTAELYRRATEEFAARVRLVGTRWTAATPCSDWDVRALVRHVVEEELWVPPLFAGRTIAEVGRALVERHGDAGLSEPVRGGHPEDAPADDPDRRLHAPSAPSVAAGSSGASLRCRKSIRQ